MLTRHISKQVTITENGKERKYTCYGDTEDKNKFYVIPETPEYVRDQDGKLKFKFLSYTGSNVSPNEGAYCTFTVRLPFPNESQKNQIRMLLIEGLQTKLEPRAKKTYAMVQAYRQQPQGDWKTIADALGVSEPEIKTLSNQFNPSQKWEQYLQVPADNAQIQLERVPFIQEGSKVELTLQDTTGAFLQRQLNPLVPSMMGDLETVFALPLTSQGAGLYEAAFKGEGDTPSIVGVVYTMCFECRLPATTVDVSYKFDRQRSLSKTLNKDAWGNKSEAIRDELSNTEAAQVKIQEGSWEGFTDKEKADLRKELEEWGKEQLNAILTQKLATIDMTKIGGRFSSGENASELLKDVGDIQRSYQAGRVVTYVVKPQVQLPGIAQIVGDRVDDYFQDVDLNSDRFSKKTVNIQVNADFEALKISTINVKLEYDDKTREKQVKTLTFNSSQSQSWSWYMRKATDNKRISTYRYSYQVTYKGESKIFEFKADQPTDQDVLTINVGDAGVLRANVKAGDINWDQIKRVQVMLKYEDGTDNQEAQIALSDTNLSSNYVQPIFKPQKQPILYRTKFYMKDGQEFWYAPGDLGPVPWATKTLDPNLFIDDPFRETKFYTIRIEKDKLDKRATSVVLNLRYQQPSVNYTISKSVSFSSSKSSEPWAVPVVDLNTAIIEYDGYIELQGAEDQLISGTVDPKNSNLLISTQPSSSQASQFSIKFSKKGMNWSNVALAKVLINYNNSEEAERIYISSDDPEGAEVEFATAIAKKGTGDPIFDHRWRVEFTMSDDTVKYFPKPTATSTEDDLPMQSSSTKPSMVYLEEILRKAAKLQVAV